MKIHCRVKVVQIENPSSNLLEICSYISSFLHCRLVQTKSKLALACVVLPNSNADSERIFSMLKIIQTEHRSELTNDTICSLICDKQNQNMDEVFFDLFQMENNVCSVNEVCFALHTCQPLKPSMREILTEQTLFSI
jgi:hypothetical protein